MKRILFLSRGGEAGGSQQQLLHVVSGLDRGRYEPVVACRDDGPFVATLRGAGIEAEVVRLRPWRKLTSVLTRYAGARRLARLAERCDAQLIHSSDIWLSGYLLHLARRRGVPSILHVRKPMRPDDLRKHCCGQAAAVVAISQRVKRNLLAAGVPAERIEVIYDSVDLERFHPRCRTTNVLRREFPRAGGALVGLVGRVTESKRQLEFLEATRDILGSRPARLTLFVIGGVRQETYLQRLRHFVRENGLEDRVIFTGRREDMPAVLGSLDVLVTLSGGSVMIEAMACGTPVVSAGFTKAGESSIVLDGQTGLLLPPGHVPELGAALSRLIEDRSLRERMGRAARQHVEARFSHRAMVDATQRLYDRLLGE